MIEDRLSRYMTTQYETVPDLESEMHRTRVTGSSGQRKPKVLAMAGMVSMLVFAVAFSWISLSDQALAASPFSGERLPVINTDPLIIRGEIGPAPATTPEGVDLTFAPIGEPTRDDIEAINHMIEAESLDSVTVVALGRITFFNTNFYAVHGFDRDGVGQSLVVAVGPNYPEFVAQHGPTADESWGPSGSQGLGGEGYVFTRTPGAPSQFAVLDVDGETFWQRSSDGFFWMPFQADFEAVKTFTTRHVGSGGVVNTMIVDPSTFHDRSALGQ